MIRSSVVLPEPEGPSSASNSPSLTLRSTPSRAAKPPNFLTRFLTSMVICGVSLVQMTFQNGLGDQRDQGQHRQQRGNREGGDELVLVVENLDQQWHRVGLAADMAGDDRDRAALAHCAGVAE